MMGATAARAVEDASAAMIAGGRSDDAYLLLRASLGHASAIVREAAALSIAETFGHRSDAAAVLARVLADDPSPAVRDACRDGLYVMSPGNRR